MPFKLQSELPDGYSSTALDVLPQSDYEADVSGIDAVLKNLRQADAALRQVAPDQHRFRESDIYNFAAHDGMVTVRSKRTKWLAGHILADRYEDRDIAVRDMFVAEEDRKKGIGGFLLGALISMPPKHGRHERELEYTVHDYGNELTLAGKRYLLPNKHVDIHHSDSLTKAGRDEVFREHVPRYWHGILSETWRDTETQQNMRMHQIIRSGEVIFVQSSELSSQYDDDTVTIGHTAYDSIVLAAVHFLNDSSIR